MHSGFDEAEDFAVIEEITGKISGEQMLLTTSIYRGVPKADAQIDPVWDAATGLANIARGDLIFEESMYVSVLPGSGILPKPGEYVPREFTATSATTNALGVLWAGVGVGPRVQMVSDAIARGAGAQEVEHLGRMYGLVAGELMWTQERSGQIHVGRISRRFKRFGRFFLCRHNGGNKISWPFAGRALRRSW